MATTLTNTSTFAGTFQDYYLAAIGASKTVGTPTIRVINADNPYKIVLKKMSAANIVQGATCSFNPSGTITLTDKAVELKEHNIMTQICKTDLISEWNSEKMNGGENLAPNFLEYYKAMQLGHMGNTIEQEFWKYTSGVASGVTVEMKSDSTVVDLSGTTVTSSNVQAQLARVIEAGAALAVYTSDEKMALYVASNVYIAYLISLGSMVASNGFEAKGPNQIFSTDLYFAGHRVIEAPGLASSEIVFAQPSNLVYVTPMDAKQNVIDVKDMYESDLSKNVSFAATWYSASTYVFGADIVYYWIF